MVFLDTEAHFPETLAFVDEVRARYGLQPDRHQARTRGGRLSLRQRAVLPVPQGRAAAARAVAGKAAWLTSLQAHRRADACRRADRELGRRVRAGQGQPAGDVDRRRHRVVSRRSRSAGAPARARGATAPSGARRRPARWPRARTRAPGVGPGSTSPSAACTSSATRPRQSLWDGIPGPARPRAQVRPPLPQHRRAELRRAAEAGAPPFEVAQAVIDTYSKQGPDSIAKVPGERSG